jgi:hypothetical protein
VGVHLLNFYFHSEGINKTYVKLEGRESFRDVIVQKRKIKIDPIQKYDVRARIEFKGIMIVSSAGILCTYLRIP